jgi:PAS domain S-box-containing protein
MLEQLSQQVRECLALAAEAKTRADKTSDPTEKAEHLKQERRWLKLASSYALTESIGDFTAANAERRRRFYEVWTDKARRHQASHKDLSQHWLAAIVESSTDGIIGTDRDGVIMSWNEGAGQVFGYAAEDVIGKPVTILIPPERHDEEPFILERIRRGEKVEHYETVRQRKDGNLIVVSLRVSPVQDDQGLIIGASIFARDITERKQVERQATVLAREAEHRTRNILATVSATVELSQSDTPEGLKAAIRGRIQALANVHALFVESRWTGAELKQIVTQELAPYRSDGTRTLIKGPKIVLEPNVAQAIAVTLHELATNAVKYGSLSTPAGRVRLTWSRSPNGELAIRWTERGGPPVTPPARHGFGTRVMHRLIEQIRGSITFDWRENGLSCKVIIPRRQG